MIFFGSICGLFIFAIYVLKKLGGSGKVKRLRKQNYQSSNLNRDSLCQLLTFYIPFSLIMKLIMALLEILFSVALNNISRIASLNCLFCYPFPQVFMEVAH